MKEQIRGHRPGRGSSSESKSAGGFWRGTTFLLALGLGSLGGCTLNDNYGESAVDPVCGTLVQKKDAPVTRTPHRKTYYFDSEECAAKFDRHPALYMDLKPTNWPSDDY